MIVTAVLGKARREAAVVVEIALAVHGEGGSDRRRHARAPTRRGLTADRGGDLLEYATVNKCLRRGGVNVRRLPSVRYPAYA
jgi:hypothetical protein